MTKEATPRLGLWEEVAWSSPLGEMIDSIATSADRISQQVVAMQGSLEGYKPGSDKKLEQAALCLFGLHCVVGGVEKKLATSRQKLLSFLQAGQQSQEAARVVRLYLGYLAHVGQLALWGGKRSASLEDAWVLINRKIPKTAKRLEIVVPLVPVKSPFTLSIAGAIRAVMEACNHGRSTSLVVGRNQEAYLATKKLLEPHLCFDEAASWTPHRRESYFRLHEKTFLAFLARMTSGAVTAKPMRPDVRWRLLDGLTQLVDLPGSAYAGTADYWAQELRNMQEIRSLPLGGLKGFTSTATPSKGSILNCFARIARDRVTGTGHENEHVVILAPFPLAVCLECALKSLLTAAPRELEAARTRRDRENIALMEKEVEAITKVDARLTIASYIPFPSTPEVMKILPFYLSEYSHLLYRSASGSEKNCRIQKRQILRLILSALEQLHVGEPLRGALQVDKYDELLYGIRDLFMEEERRQREYLRYV